MIRVGADEGLHIDLILLIPLCGNLKEKNLTSKEHLKFIFTKH
jgi:hypothetical protein